MKKVLIILFFIIFSSMLAAQNHGKIPPINFRFTGDMLYYFLADNNINDTNRFEIENIKADITGGIKFFNRKNLAGLALIRIDSDSTIYKLSAYKVFVNYFTPAFKLAFFYKYRVENYNDGFRLLDDDIASFYQPVIFYRDKKLKKTAYWGKDYTGVKLSLNKFISQDLILAKKVDNDEENKFSVISRTVKEFDLSEDIKVLGGLNFIYIKQDYTLPQVNSSSWAEYNGVWYEFNTNSFYDLDNDYKIKASGEFGVTLLNMLRLWGEAGIDNKYGGYYGETTQMATSSGNINYVLVLNSAGYKNSIFGGGVKLDLDFLILDASYKRINAETSSFSVMSNNLILSNKASSINDITVKLRADLGFIESSLAFQLEDSGDDTHFVLFDKFNFLNRFYLYAEKVMRIRSFNKINFGFLKIYPELEYSKYRDDLKTMEINGGAEVSLYKKLSFYGNVRYKNYIVESINRSFINPFISFRYSYNRKIYFEIGYGLDNRLLYDNEYGFEYYLNNYIGSSYYYLIFPVDATLNAEENISKNNYIFITGHIGF